MTCIRPAGTGFAPGLYLLAALALTGVLVPSLPSAAAADCAAPPFDAPRDDERYRETLSACDSTETTTSDGEALLGYLYRHGYGVPRDSGTASTRFAKALELDACNEYAVCGLRALSGGGVGVACDVDCDALARRVSGAGTAKDENDGTDTRKRAYRLLSEMQRNATGPESLAVDELGAALDEILAQEQQTRDKAFRELCTSHIKRAVVTVSLAYQLERETRRRAKLIAHHEKKVRADNNARSQAALQSLAAAQRRAVADRQVFFEKYTGAAFSASGCEPATLEDSYETFRREIAEIKVTDLERQAFGLFQGHVEAARAGQGISSDWFGNLGELLRD